MMIKRLLAGLLAGAVIGAGVTVWAGMYVRIIVDGREVQSDVAPRVEQGRTLVPLRFVAEALGAEVTWEDQRDGGTVVIRSVPKFFSPHGPSAGVMAPSDLSAAGAAAALTQYLAQEQAASLTSGGPVLVRFDLLDLKWYGYPPPDDIRRLGEKGFKFYIRLYYAQLEGREPPLYQFVRKRKAGGGISVGSVPPAVQASWYEDHTIWVVPAGPPEVRTEGDTDTVIWGREGWTVDAASRKVVQKVTLEQPPFLIHGATGR